MKITRRLVISGYVQGVYYRDSMRIEADRLGVTGWVRNRRDGTVEAMVQGEAARVETIIAWARHGPPAARVDNLEIGDGTGSFTSFERTAST
jgi:acylphosphatase